MTLHRKRGPASGKLGVDLSRQGAGREIGMLPDPQALAVPGGTSSRCLRTAVQVFVEIEAKPPLNSLDSSVLSADSCLSTFLRTRRPRRTLHVLSSCYLSSS